MKELLSSLLQSRKFIVSLLAMVCITILAMASKIDTQQTVDFCKYILSVWLASHALEEGLSRSS